MMGILKLTNQEVVWSNLIKGFNQVIKSIAPTKVVQSKKSYQPFINEDILDHIERTNLQLTRAIETSDIGEWRCFKVLRNQVTKLIDFAKKAYYLNKTDTMRNIWSNIKTRQKRNN